MTQDDLKNQLFEGLASFDELAATNGVHPRSWKRLAERLGVRVVRIGRKPYADLADLKAKMREGPSRGRGRPRSPASRPGAA